MPESCMHDINMISESVTCHAELYTTIQTLSHNGCLINNIIIMHCKYFHMQGALSLQIALWDFLTVQFQKLAVT